MVDVLTKEQRSYNMSQVRGRNTKPEIQFRKLLYSRGLKGYRISVRLPGKPDILYPKYRLAIFIDGCFWHKCPKCFSFPATNKKFWMKKINGNARRDRRVNSKLKDMGYVVIRFWEHELEQDIDSCAKKVLFFLKRLKKKNREGKPFIKRGIIAVDLFCGAGGLTRGLINAGITVKKGYDNDPKIKETYEKNNDGAQYY